MWCRFTAVNSCCPSIPAVTAHVFVLNFVLDTSRCAGAGDATQTSKCSWLAARVLLCCKGDKDLTAHVFETTARDGLLGAKTAPAQAAAAWVRMWLGSSELEREALLMLLTKRAKMQVGCRESSCMALDVWGCVDIWHVHQQVSVQAWGAMMCA